MNYLSVAGALLWHVVLFLGVFVLPGYILVKPAANRLFSHEAAFYSVLFSIFLAGSFFYMAAMILGFAIRGLYFHDYHVLIVALLVSLLLLCLTRRFNVEPASTSPQKALSNKQKRMLIGAMIVVAVFYIANYDEKLFRLHIQRNAY